MVWSMGSRLLEKKVKICLYLKAIGRVNKTEQLGGQVLEKGD
jgi:translation initiation factor IF-3